jgi:hypothetical protein
VRVDALKREAIMKERERDREREREQDCEAYSIEIQLFSSTYHISIKQSTSMICKCVIMLANVV